MRVLWGLALWWSMATPALAQPCASVDLALSGCDAWIDRAHLEVALATEGVCAASLRCEGGTLTILDGEAQVTHALAPMPEGVRARIVALLVAEQLRPGAARPEPDPPSSGVAEDPAVAPSIAPAAVDARALAPPEPGATDVVRNGPVETAGPALRRSSPRGLHNADARALDTPLVSIGVGAHVRVFLDPVTALAGPSAWLRVDALEVELGWGFGVSQDASLGLVNLSLGTLSAGLTVACARWAEGGLCAGARATVGYAAADPEPANGATGDRSDGAYVGGDLELTGYVSTEELGLSLSVRGGWGYGLVVRAEGREIAALGGGWLGARLGVDYGGL